MAEVLAAMVGTGCAARVRERERKRRGVLMGSNYRIRVGMPGRSVPVAALAVLGTCSVLLHYYFREARIICCVVYADHDQVLPCSQAVDGDMELLAWGIGDAVHGFYGHPRAGVQGV